jgi:hypothetical protein
MNGLDIKRGVTATMERVVAASGKTFGKLEVVWTGKSAGITYQREENKINATVFFPAVDNMAQVSRSVFNNLIGYALHEGLGHALYTDNHPWDEARDKHGAFMHQLINGLEDPRIEQCAIDSGYAPNSKILFENLLNSVLAEDGYVEPDDLKNIPFLCAVEGRRLNGYSVIVPSILDQSPLAVPIRKALLAAQSATNTAAVVKAAIELHDHIKKEQQQQQQQQQQGGKQVEGKKQDGQQQKSEEGKEGEGSGDAQSESDTEGTPDPNKPPTAPMRGSQHGAERSVEPTSFINRQLEQHMPAGGNQPPAVGQPKIATFKWE